MLKARNQTDSHLPAVPGRPLDFAGPQSPAGQAPNYVNPPNKNKEVLAVTFVCVGLMTLAGLLRILSRTYVTKKFRVEDFLAFAAFGASFGSVWCHYEMAYSTPGWFVPIWDLKLHYIVRSAYIVHMGSNFYVTNMLLIKAAIILEWNRIFVPTGTRNMFYWFSLTIVWVNSIFYGASLMIMNLRCRPYAYIWDKTISDGWCFDSDDEEWTLTSSCIDLISDIAVFIMPQQVIWRSLMATKQKIGISCLFGLGIFALICSCFRLAAVVDFIHHTDDALWTDEILVWGYARIVILFFIFCMPCIPKTLHAMGLLSAFGCVARTVTGAYHSHSHSHSKTTTTQRTSQGSSHYASLQLPEFGGVALNRLSACACAASDGSVDGRPVAGRRPEELVIVVDGDGDADAGTKERKESRPWRREEDYFSQYP